MTSKSFTLWAALIAALALVSTALIAGPATASGTAFAPVKGGTPGALVSPANGEMWVGVSTDAGLRIDRFKNGAKTSTTYPGVPSGTLAGTATDDVWLNSGTALLHFDGTSWNQVALPTGPAGEVLYPAAMDDVAGPDFYVMFTYWATTGNDMYATTLGHFDGSTWTLLGEPAGDYTFESVMKLEVTDTGIVALASTYRGMDEYVLSYVDGAWKTPVQVGRYFCCSVNKWAYDWVVKSPTSVWLYGDNTDDNGSKALCAHFDGTGLDDSPCVTGRNRFISLAAELPDGRHMVAGEAFDLLRQPDQSASVGATSVTGVTSMAVEQETGVVWAVATRSGVSTLMRYGVLTDTEPFVVTASLVRTTVEKGNLATIQGTIAPVPAAGADRTVVVEIKRSGQWKKVTTSRASAAGAYRVSIEQPTVGVFEYRVRKPATGALEQGVSPTLTVTVLQPFRVTASASGKVKRGQKLVISGKVTPKSAAGGGFVVLQFKSGRKWKSLVDALASASGRYRITVIFKSLGTRKLRVLKQASGVRSAQASRILTVKVVR